LAFFAGSRNLLFASLASWSDSLHHAATVVE
jgi:hypothetical protein